MTNASLVRKAGLLLDTNLLILFVVGMYDRKRIAQNKRTSTYTAKDFDLLLDFMDRFQQFVTTPNILTEVSNLLEGVSYQSIPVLTILPELTKDFVELHEPSYPVMTGRSKIFIKFGLSDVVSCYVAERDYVILTDDLKLCYYLQNNGFAALNFNNLRSDYLIT